MSHDHEDMNGLDARISMKGYFERILVERERATELAETEREKAAQQVRVALEAQMLAGDARLEDHITHQVEQVRQGLASLTLLLTERDGRMDDRFAAQNKAATLALDNASEAIKVARTESTERLTQHNGLIQKMEKLTESFPTRKEVEEGIGRRVSGLEKFQYMLGGGIVLLGFLGVGTVVKLFIG